MEPLKMIDENTPIGTEVIVVSAMHVPATMYRTTTRSEPWRIGRELVVAVKGRTGGYGSQFVHVLPAVQP